MNKSFFTGKPIVPDYMDKKLLSKYQYTTYTSEVAKGISRAINTMIGNDYTKLDNNQLMSLAVIIEISCSSL